EAQAGGRVDQPHGQRRAAGKGPAQELAVVAAVRLPSQRRRGCEQQCEELLHLRALPRTRERSSASGSSSASSAPQPTQVRPLRSRTARLAPTANLPSAMRETSKTPRVRLRRKSTTSS